MKKLILALLPFALASLLRGAAALPSITFSTSQPQFTGGDAITIQEVFASSPSLGLGDTFVVRGTYTLQSQPAAVLEISLSNTGVGVPGQASARRQVSAGTGSFEMEYTVQIAGGSIYIAFTPVTGGASIGRIYLTGGQFSGSGSTTPTTPTTPTAPRTPHVPPPISTEGLASVPFGTSRVQFVGGDSITLQEVLASSPNLQPGDTVVVRGQYNLQSRADAVIMISLTVNAPGSSTPVSPRSYKDITAGAGTFELAYEVTQPGALHVTFYPGGDGGSSFGGVYFAPPGGSSTPTSVVAVTSPTANTGKLGNLSVRSQITSGGGTLVAGITVTEQERYVLIRGVGPSLAALGVTGALRKPVLSVYNSSGELVATAGAWSTAFTGDRRLGIEMLSRSVGAFPLTAGSDDAVLNLRLVPGGYTVSLATSDGQPGVGLLEVYASATYTLPP